MFLFCCVCCCLSLECSYFVVFVVVCLSNVLILLCLSLKCLFFDRWTRGDVIGCCFDGDSKSLRFFKNGLDMGVAFSEIEQGPGIAFFPAASMSTNETLRFNFGETPFLFPVAEFAPISLIPCQLAEVAKRFLSNPFFWICFF